MFRKKQQNKSDEANVLSLIIGLPYGVEIRCINPNDKATWAHPGRNGLGKPRGYRYAVTYRKNPSKYASDETELTAILRGLSNA